MMPCIGHDLPYTVFLPKLNKSTKPNPAFSSIRRKGSQKNKLDSKKKMTRQIQILRHSIINVIKEDIWTVEGKQRKENYYRPKKLQVVSNLVKCIVFDWTLLLLLFNKQKTLGILVPQSGIKLRPQHSVLNPNHWTDCPGFFFF